MGYMIFIRKYPTQQLLINNYIVVSRQHSSYTRKNNTHKYFFIRKITCDNTTTGLISDAWLQGETKHVELLETNFSDLEKD